MQAELHWLQLHCAWPFILCSNPGTFVLYAACVDTIKSVWAVMLLAQAIQTLVLLVHKPGPFCDIQMLIRSSKTADVPLVCCPSKNSCEQQS